MPHAAPCKGISYSSFVKGSVYMFQSSHPGLCNLYCRYYRTQLYMELEDVSFQFLREITDGFSEERILGQGAFGVVYKVRFGHDWLL